MSSNDYNPRVKPERRSGDVLSDEQIAERDARLDAAETNREARQVARLAAGERAGRGGGAVIGGQGAKAKSKSKKVGTPLCPMHHVQLSRGRCSICTPPEKQIKHCVSGTRETQAAFAGRKKGDPQSLAAMAGVIAPYIPSGCNAKLIGELLRGYYEDEAA